MTGDKSITSGVISVGTKVLLGCEYIGFHFAQRSIFQACDSLMN